MVIGIYISSLLLLLGGQWARTRSDGEEVPDVRHQVSPGVVAAQRNALLPPFRLALLPADRVDYIAQQVALLHRQVGVGPTRFNTRRPLILSLTYMGQHLT